MVFTYFYCFTWDWLHHGIKSEFSFRWKCMVIFTAVAAVVLMLGGVINYLGNLLTFQGVFLLSWAAILISDALVVKKVLKIGPKYFEHRQDYLYAWNPVGVLSLIISSVVGSIAAFGYMGIYLQNVAAFFAAVLASIITIVLAIITKGKYYSKKVANDISNDEYIA